jgi:hypothetical protein
VTKKRKKEVILTKLEAIIILLAVLILHVDFLLPRSDPIKPHFNLSWAATNELLNKRFLLTTGQKEFIGFSQHKQEENYEFFGIGCTNDGRIFRSLPYLWKIPGTQDF